MLKLQNLVKTYGQGDNVVTALRGVSINFRKSEFVSVLGPSGCGKTTLLNIIGGLDHFTDGDLVISGRSTKNFRDKDWDAYRNNSIGFVFQNYNLIPHQSVISNVELALTLSGVSRAERRARAKQVLIDVGLGDQLHKKPNQLSGGQAQRVAIARALINDPDILLADEPTGALDTDTSVSVMQLLKNIAKDRLVIMVTHNPDLANEYSTRIVRLLDGRVISDTNPHEGDSDGESKVQFRSTHMNMLTAFGLSLKNLLTKKTRTILTAFAGSIGIIGIALILALSSGLNGYIANVERDTLSSFPITIEKQSLDTASLMQSFMGEQREQETNADKPLDRVYAHAFMARMMKAFTNQVKQNDLKSFKAYIEEHETELKDITTAISYTYDVPMNLYSFMPDGKLNQVNPSQMTKVFYGDQADSMASGGSLMSGMMGNQDMWQQLIPNEEYLETQYDVISGTMPAAYNEAVLVVDESNSIADLMLYALGIKGEDELVALRDAMLKGEGEVDAENSELAYSEIIGLEFSLVLPVDLYEQVEGVWQYRGDDAAYVLQAAQTATKIKIVGILRPSEDAAAVANQTFIGYTAALSDFIIGYTNASQLVKEQLAAPETDVLTGIDFDKNNAPEFKSPDEFAAFAETLPEAEKQQLLGVVAQLEQASMTDEQKLSAINMMMKQATTSATYEGNLEAFGVVEKDRPAAINIYPSSFENKDAVIKFIGEYNKDREEGTELVYTDFVGLLMSSITTVINAISYILIAFVSISLVVSSIMIGIITYISVLERTREIGVLRAMGASKKDISRVFNAETITVGFAAGLLGVLVTALLCIPANIIIKNLTDISGVASLPFIGAAALILISTVLTLLAGLIPSGVAARKDPVVALRTE
ncbi:MAG: ABC transporter ATP-binding protein/permease [Oscillospiraceae bacterium]|jgi:putative ABC transport system permease protein|nr:ABC transporter ATP-binding protein/permease [Oscillospiraceae bacterium]